MKHEFHDPVTGDLLSLGEHVSWIVQGIIRRWLFLILVTIITLVAWIIGTSVGEVLVWWNLAASFLAIVIESIVGIAMYSQTKRDAVLLRKLNRLMEHTSEVADKEEAELRGAEKRLLFEDAQIEQILQHLDMQDKMMIAMLRKLDADLNGWDH